MKNKNIKVNNKFIDFDNERSTSGFFDFPEGRNIYFVGDLHGDFGVLLSTLFDCSKVLKWTPPNNNHKKGELTWIGKDSIVVFCGDLCDRKRDSTFFNTTKKNGIYIDIGNGEIDNEEFKILHFINYVNSLALKHNGKLIKIVGNHEIMNFGPERSEWKNFDVHRYCKHHNNNHHATPLALYNDNLKGGRCNRFAPKGDINKELIQDYIYGIIKINNSGKKWIACHGGINENILYGITKGRYFGSSIEEVDKIIKSYETIEKKNSFME